VNINRLNKDFTPSIISVNLADIFNGKAEDIMLMREDKVTVFSILELRESYTVTIHGEINGIRESSDKKKVNNPKRDSQKDDNEDSENESSSEIADKLNQITLAMYC